MRIAVLSGKGGTGKTFVSVSLACAAGRPAYYVDCDVEEPNGHLFLKPQVTGKTAVTVAVPQLDADRCTGCRKCAEFCRYNAVAMIKNKPMIFYEVCHSCGGCILFCPEKALREIRREIGFIEEGVSGDVAVLTGCLNTGEISGVPIIRELIKRFPRQGCVLIDCPPGSACVVMESIREADYCLLVAEPTLFGVHNLAMVHELAALFGKPLGVLLNKCLPGEENPAEKYCESRGIKIVESIPFDDGLARLCSNGLVASRESARYRELFQRLLKTLEKEVAR